MILRSSYDVAREIERRLRATEGPIAVMAGHFALVQYKETGAYVPGIPRDIDDDATRRFVKERSYMGNFADETWCVGAEVVRNLREEGRDAKLLVLVNDWQHVPPAESGKRNAARDAYFADATLPKSLRTVLNAYELDESSLLFDERDGKSSLLWAESKLRARYNRHLRRRVPVESPCAQEWVPILARLEELGYGGFAAFVPGVCRVPIIGGTELAEELLDLELKSTIVSPGGGPDDFWSNTWIEV